MKNSIFTIIFLLISSIIFAQSIESGNTRYWVNGGGVWNNSNNWSYESGGKPGAIVPSGINDVVFDDNSFNSNNNIVVIGNMASCRNFTWNAKKAIPELLVKKNTQLFIFGSFIIYSEITNKIYGDLIFKTGNQFREKEIYIKSEIPGKIIFDGSRSKWVLKNRLTVLGNIIFKQGALHTDNNDILCNEFNASGILRREINLGSSRVVVSSWDISDYTNLNFQGKSSTIFFRKDPIVKKLNYFDLSYGIVSPYRGDIDSKDLGILGYATFENTQGCFYETGSISATGVVNSGTFPPNYQWKLTDIDNNDIGDSPRNGVALGDLPSTYSGLSNYPKVDYYGYFTDINNTTDYYFVQFEADSFSIASVTVVDATTIGGNGKITIEGKSWNAPARNLWYSVNNGGSYQDDSVFNVPAGDYTVAVRDADGCEVSGSTYTVKEPSASITLDSIDVIQITCHGENDDTIRVYTTDNTGTVYYSNYDDNDHWQLSNEFADQGAGSYIIRVYDDNDTVAYASNPVTIVNPDQLVYDSTTVVKMLCHDDNDAVVTCHVTGGTEPYTYKFPPNIEQLDDSVFTNVSSGQYTLTVTDDHGCVVNSLKVIVENPTEVIIDDVVISDYYLDCYTDSTSSITITAHGGTGSLQYSIDGGANWSTNTVYNNIPAGDYDIWVKDDNDCTKTYPTETITSGDEIVVTGVVSNSPLDCYGDSDGTITITASGGTGTLGYSIDDGSTYPKNGGNFSNLVAGTYYTSVKDQVGCYIITDTIEITQPDTLSVVATDMLLDCNGDSDGTSTATPTGGNGGNAFQWYNDRDLTSPIGGATAAIINGLSAGTYWVKVTDSKGCWASDSTIISENDAVTFIENHTDMTCNATCDGTITVTASGGDGVYLYSKNNGTDWDDNGGAYTGLCNATYKIKVKDGNDCLSIMQNILISEPDAVTFTTSKTDEHPCNESDNGSITVTASGGSLSYTYSKDDGANYQPGNVFNGLIAATYKIKVKDSNGCESDFSSVTIGEPGIVDFTTVNTNITCNEGVDGQIVITGIGGSGTYTYSKNGGTNWQASNTFAGLSAGDYNIRVRDDNLCVSDVQVITLTEPAVVDFTSAVTDVTCNGDSDGQIVITASGGDLTYTYSKDDGSNYQASNTFSGLSAGNYSIKVKDGNDCESTTKLVAVGEPDEVDFTSSVTDATCNTDSDGEIVITASGGNSTYTYSKNGGIDYQASNTFSGLSAGNYSIKVKDGNDCESTTEIVAVGEPAEVDFTTTDTDLTCNGDTDGEIVVTASGGNLTYTYSKNGGTDYQASNTFSGLSAGDYSIKVKDGNNCESAVQVVNISEPAAVDFTYTTDNVTCNAGIDGEIVITASGGDLTYTYSKDGGSNYQASNTFSGLSAGDYNVIVKDGNDCESAVQVVSITEPAVVDFTSAVTDATCNGDSDGQIVITASGGNLTYTYSKNGGTDYQASNTFSGLSAGNYSIKVKDGNDCESTTELVAVGEPAEVDFTTTDTDLTCNGDTDGEIVVTASGGNLTYTYSKNGGTDYQASNTFSGLTAGDYNIKVKDGNNCESVVKVVNISEPAAVDFTYTTTNVTCNAGVDGEIVITASGGDLTYTYSNDGGSNYQASNTFSGLSAGDYNVIVKDGNDCESDIQEVTITEPAVVDFTSVITDATCNGDSDGQIVITASGGDLTYTYSKNGGTDYQASNTFSGLLAGDYNIKVKDGNDCESSVKVVTVGEPDLIVATIVDSLLSCGSLAVVDASETFLPDGTGATYESTVTQTEFAPGATLTDPSDIQNLCLNIEHSYIQDLTVELICPSPALKSIIIADGVPSSAWLGEPVKDEDDFTFPELNTDAGDGYLYCFNSSGTDTWADAASWDSTYTYTDNSGFEHTDKLYIPEGSYASEDPFADLVGCPLNGDWTIKITDNLMGDNGYLFTWNLTFDPSTYPPNYCNGMAEVDAIGGNAGGFSYMWSNGMTDAIVTDLCADDYHVTVTDTKGCKGETIAYIEDVDIQMNSDIVDVVCSGDNNGSATINVWGGNLPYTFLWDNGATTETIDGLTAGTYRVTVTDDNTCEYYDSVIVGYTNLFTFEFTDVTTTACNSATTGSHLASATINVTSGTGPYTYSWSSGENTVTAVSLVAGWNYVTVTDTETTCTANDSVEISEAPELTASITDQTNVLCFGDESGIAIVTPAGGTPATSGNPYLYLWNDILAQTDSTANGLLAGDYSVTVTDDNACEVIVLTTITQPSIMEVVIATTPTTGCAASDGEITLTPSGGEIPYTYHWTHDPGLNNPTASGLSGGVYTVQIEDINGCTIDTSATVENDTDLAIDDYTTTDVTCFGLTDGIATANISGGEEAYNVQWYSDAGYTNPIVGETSATLSGMYPDSVYYIEVVDNQSCKVYGSISVSEPTVVTAEVTDSTAVLCFGEGTGTATVAGTGGTGTYTYSWEDNFAGSVSTEITATNLFAGTYYVTVYDGNLCEAYDSVIIEQPATALTAEITDTTMASCNADDGEAIITPAGGTTPYLYNWEDILATTISTDSTASDLGAGWYWVTVYDDNACTYVDSIEIKDTSDLEVNVTINNNVLCYDDSTGKATALAVNGTGPFTYSWSNGEEGSIADSLWAGTFTVTLTDLGTTCTATDIFTISQPTQMQVTPTVTDVLCAGGNSGSIVITPGGGTPNSGSNPYTYNWSIANTDSIAEDLVADEYSVTVTDANACTLEASYTVNENPVIEVTYSTTLTQCNDSSGTATIDNILGGTPFTIGDPYLISWSHDSWTVDSTGLSISDLWVDFYQLTITDSLGCSIDTLVRIDADTDLLITMTDSANASCFGSQDGIAVATPSGGTSPYTYLWSDDAATTDSVVTNLFADVDYFVTVTDAGGCIAVNSIMLSQPSEIISNLQIENPIVCASDTIFNLFVQPTGGTPFYDNSYDIVWTDDNDEIISTDTIINDLRAGKYFVMITDSLECYSIDSITIIQPNEILVTIVTSLTECADSTGSAEITNISGGIPFTVGNPYLVRWSHPDWILDSTSTTINNLWVDVYYLEIEDSLGCIYYDTVNIEDDSDINFEVTILNHITCLDRCDGKAEIESGNILNVGGTPQFIWYLDSGNETTQQVEDLCLGEYRVRVIDDANGCSHVRTFEITDEEALNTRISYTNDISCPGESGSGSARVIADGGVEPYDYLWDHEGRTSDQIYGLSPGVYHVTVTDANTTTCTVFDSIEIVADPIVISRIEIQDVLCNGDSTGSIIVEATGGHGNYTYTWYEGDTQVGSDTIIEFLPAGTYKIVAKDDAECQVTQDITIDEPNALNSRFDITKTNCYDSSGVAIITVDGGVEPYLFDWSDDIIAENTARNLWIGTFYVTITDDNACVRIDTVDVEDNSPFKILPGNVQEINCFDYNNGSAEVLPIDGVEPYNYTWSHNDAINESTVSDLAPGIYIVTVVDNETCVRTDTIAELINPERMIISFADTVLINCFDSCNGAISVIPYGGTVTDISDYSYIWKVEDDVIAHEATNTLDSLCEGIYNVVVKDVLGCPENKDYVLVSPTKIEITSLDITNAACNVFDETGFINIEVSGGQVSETTYLYSWSNGAETQDIEDLEQGKYYVTIVDNNDCYLIDSATVGANNTIFADAWVSGMGVNSDTTICYGDTIQLLADFDPAGSTVSWTPAYNINDINSLAPKVNPTLKTEYILRVENGDCYNLDTVEIDIYDRVVIEIGPNDSLFIGDFKQFFPIGGTDSTIYSWLPNYFISNPDTIAPIVYPERDTTYFVYATTGLCTVIDSIFLHVFLELDPPTGITPNGDGVNDTWILDGVTEYPNVEVKIFNRWGEIVFSNTGRYTPWDGKNTKGKDLPIGTYYFIIHLHDERGTAPMSGPITIMR